MKRVWTGGDRPPRPRRPGPGEPVSIPQLVELVLWSIPTAATLHHPSGTVQPEGGPLTPEEAERVNAYLTARAGPAADGERRRRGEEA